MVWYQGARTLEPEGKGLSSSFACVYPNLPICEMDVVRSLMCRVIVRIKWGKYPWGAPCRGWLLGCAVATLGGIIIIPLLLAFVSSLPPTILSFFFSPHLKLCLCHPSHDVDSIIQGLIPTSWKKIESFWDFFFPGEDLTLWYWCWQKQVASPHILLSELTKLISYLFAKWMLIYFRQHLLHAGHETEYFPTLFYFIVLSAQSQKG